MSVAETHGIETPHDIGTLQQRYDLIRQRSSDIHAHLPRLMRLASECSHVTEFGSRYGASTTALLLGKPKKLVVYDIVKQTEMSELESWAGDTEFVFKLEDTSKVEIEPTDLLFIDTYHVYDQLKAELRQAPKVRKYIAMHDTCQNATIGEDLVEGHGLGRAIGEFLNENPIWTLLAIYFDDCGMTVLKRKS